jgi:hypothetical protein
MRGLCIHDADTNLGIAVKTIFGILIPNDEVMAGNAVGRSRG